jgi:hypothetical protein
LITGADRWRKPQRGVNLADEPTVEVTLDDPRTTPPERLRTEMRVRLA